MRKRLKPVNATEGSPSEDSFVLRVISSYNERLDHFRTLERGGKYAKTQRNNLGLTEPELSALRYHAGKRFFELARLSDELRYKPDEQSPQISDAEMYAVLFYRICEPAISEACGEYADLLTQALLVRRSKKSISTKLREALWAEVLRFRGDLSRWENIYFWVDRAWGKYRVSQDFDPDTFKQTLTRRLREGGSSRLSESDRRIELRLLLSGNSTRIPIDNRSKMAALECLEQEPTASVRVLCAKLDAMNDRQPRSAPVPSAWKGTRSWVVACEDMGLHNRVKVFFSKLRRLL